MDEDLTEAIGDTQVAVQEPVAWSDEPEEPPTRSGKWVVLTAVVVAFLALLVAVAAADVVLMSHQKSPKAAPTTTAVMQTPRVLPPPRVEPPPPPPISRDDQFVATMEHNHFMVRNTEALIRSAYEICSNLMNGATRDDIDQHALEAMQGRYTYADAHRYVGIAIQFYCPQQGGWG